MTTRNKRASAVGFGLAAFVILPVADATIDQLDRAQAVASYAGTTAHSPVRTTQVVQTIAAVQPPSPLRLTQVVQGFVAAMPLELRLTQVVRTMVVLPVEPTPPAQGTNPEVVYIRRVRRTPHLSSELAWLIYDELTLDLEAGVGLTSGQGEDPQIMLRYSDDGGKTWSHERWESAGRKGRYGTDVSWQQLGRSRDRVFEIAVSDPVKWHLLDGFLRFRKGRPS